MREIVRMTVEELGSKLTNHEDIAVSLQIQPVIKKLLEEGEVNEHNKLSSTVLEKIRQGIYKQARNPNPQEVLLAAMAGETGNPTEAALQYIEGLQRHYSDE